VISNKLRRDGLAPLIAIVGSDGSGKTTLSLDLKHWLEQSRPVEYSYLGLRSNDVDQWIKSMPVIGQRVSDYFTKRAGQARKKEGKISGPGTAMVLYGFSLIRKRRFAAMMAKRRRGVLVITDRYPQTEVPGFYDGPGLSAARGEGGVVRWLTRREYKLYEQMASIKPDLVIRLNIDIDTALARTNNHQRDLLEAKIAVTPKLKFGGAHIVDLSAAAPYEQVLANAKQAVQAMLDSRR